MKIKLLSILLGSIFCASSWAGVTITSSLDFGTVAVGATVANKDVILTYSDENFRIGRVILENNKFDLSSPDKTCTGKTYSTGTSCKLVVKIDTSKADNTTGKLIIYTINDSNTETRHEISLAGVVEPTVSNHITVSVASVDFGSLDLDRHRLTTLEVKNTGKNAIDLTATAFAATLAGVAGDNPVDQAEKVYSIQQNGCSGTLNPFTSCYIIVRSEGYFISVIDEIKARVNSGQHKGTVTFAGTGITFVNGTVNLLTNISNVFPNNLSLPITIERKSTEAQKYLITSERAAVDIVCPKADGSACAETGFTSDAYKISCDSTGAAGDYVNQVSTAKTCGLVLKILPEDMSDKIIKIGITHPLND